MSETFRCEACGGVFESDSTEAQLDAEAAAFADQPETEMATVCDVCWHAMREVFPTLDARLKLSGL